MEHLEYLTTLKTMKLKQLQEERAKSELAKVRLSRNVLGSIAKQGMTASHPETGTDGETRAGGCDFRIRNISILKSISDSNRLKLQRKEAEQLKKAMVAQRLKADQGLEKVHSKLFEPTVASLLGRGVSEPTLLETKLLRSSWAVSPKIKCNGQDSTRGEGIRSLKTSDESTKTTAEQQSKTTDKAPQLNAEESRQFLKPMTSHHELVTRLTPSDSVLLEGGKLLSSPMTSSKKTEELSSQAPVIVDMGVFRKKHKLSSKVKVFIVKGPCYQDVIQALLNRSKL
jgi:hypothetical protein